MATQTASADPATVEEDRFQALMWAISSCKTTLMAKIDLLQMDFELMWRDMDKFCGRLGEAERHVGNSEDSIRDHCTSIHTLLDKMKALESRAEDSENRSRQNNLRVVGLPEGARGKTPRPSQRISFALSFLGQLSPSTKLWKGPIECRLSGASRGPLRAPSSFGC